MASLFESFQKYLTKELVKKYFTNRNDPGSFGERAQGCSERNGSCFFMGVSP